MEILDTVAEFGNAIWTFFGNEDNRERSTAIATVVATLLGVLAMIWAILTFIVRPVLPEQNRKPVTEHSAPLPPPEPMLQITLAQFEEKQRDLRDAIKAELQTAHETERARLKQQLDAVNARLAEPQKALEKAQITIPDMAARLDRDANELGADKVAEAKAALAQLDYDKAEALFEEIRDRAQLGVEQAARAEYGLGEIAEARVDWAKAAEHYERAATLAPDFGRLCKAREYTWRAGRLEKSLIFGGLLLDAARADGTQEQLAVALNEHAATLRAMGRFDEAETLYRQAIEIGKATIGESHPDYAARLNNLAGVLQAMGRFEDAEPLYRQATGITKATLGETHPDFASHLNNLAHLLSDMGRFDEAEPLFRQAIGIDKATIGETHPDYATRLNNLAGLLQDMGRFGEAEPLFREAIGIGKTTIGETHPDYATRLNNLAALYFQMGRFAEAEPLMAQALAIRESRLPPDHPYTAGSRQDLAAIRARLR